MTQKIIPSNIIRNFSMEYGTFLGLLWIAVFFATVYGIRLENGLLSLLGNFGFIAMAVLPVYLTVRMRRIAYRLHYEARFIFWVAIVLSMFAYATLLSSAAHFVYFNYLDHGDLFNAMHNILTNYGFKEAYIKAGMHDEYKQFEEGFDLIEKASTVDITLVLANLNFYMSLIATLPVVLISHVFKSTKN